MTWDMSPEEFRRASAQAPEERYRFALKRIAEHTEVWGLVQEEQSLWAVGTDAEGRDFFPIWPHPLFAEACARDEWAGFVPQQVDLEDFVEELVPALERDGQDVSLFSTPESLGHTVDTFEFFRDLEAELAQYE